MRGQDTTGPGFLLDTPHQCLMLFWFPRIDTSVKAALTQSSSLSTSLHNVVGNKIESYLQLTDTELADDIGLYGMSQRMLGV